MRYCTLWIGFSILFLTVFADNNVQAACTEDDKAQWILEDVSIEEIERRCGEPEESEPEPEIPKVKPQAEVKPVDPVTTPRKQKKTVARVDPEEEIKKTLNKIARSLYHYNRGTTEAGRLIQQFISQHGQETLKKRLKVRPQAHYHLGLIYRKGYGISQDNQQAVYWFQLAANKGHAIAQNRLGYMYRHGYGVEQSDQRAVMWYTRSANHGYSMAQFNLGSMYRKGYGVDENYDKAISLYRKAARQGNKRAKKVLKFLEEN